MQKSTFLKINAFFFPQNVVCKKKTLSLQCVSGTKGKRFFDIGVLCAYFVGTMSLIFNGVREIVFYFVCVTQSKKNCTQTQH